MNIRSADHGRSLIEQLQTSLSEKTQIGHRSVLQQKAPKVIEDVFEKAPEKKPEENGSKNAVEAGGLNISFQFDLFYELSSKVEAKMGRSGADRFVELSGKVSETFMGNFSLSIDPVGSFMNGTEKSLEISPETTNQFFDAVEGLADLSPEALENFLKESDNFFNKLKETYGEANGAFDQIKGLMQDQAKAFFADVDGARKMALEGPKIAENTLPAATAKPESLPASAESGQAPLITLTLKPEKTASQNDYQAFLEDFFNYAMKFRQQMFDKLLNSRMPGYEKMMKSAEEGSESSKNLINTAG